MRATSTGFSLVEVALSLGIAAFCLVAVFALLPLGLSNNQQSSEETVAVNILSSVLSDLRSCPLSTPPGSESVATTQFEISIPANPVTTAPAVQTFYFNETSLEPDGGTSLRPTSRYKLDVTFLPNSTNGARSATLVLVRVSWPAPAVAPSGKVETLLALDRN